MKDNNTRFHFVNLMKVTKDFLGEHLSPMTESDCIALVQNKDLINKINKALENAGLENVKVQLNWSEDQGSTWVQYPKSK